MNTVMSDRRNETLAAASQALLFSPPFSSPYSTSQVSQTSLFSTDKFPYVNRADHGESEAMRDDDSMSSTGSDVESTSDESIADIGAGEQISSSQSARDARSFSNNGHDSTSGEQPNEHVNPDRRISYTTTASPESVENDEVHTHDASMASTSVLRDPPQMEISRAELSSSSTTRSSKKIEEIHKSLEELKTQLAEAENIYRYEDNRMVLSSTVSVRIEDDLEELKGRRKILREQRKEVQKHIDEANANEREWKETLRIKNEDTKRHISARNQAQYRIDKIEERKEQKHRQLKRAKLELELQQRWSHPTLRALALRALAGPSEEESSSDIESDDEDAETSEPEGSDDDSNDDHEKSDDESDKEDDVSVKTEDESDNDHLSSMADETADDALDNIAEMLDNIASRTLGGNNTDHKPDDDLDFAMIDSLRENFCLMNNNVKVEPKHEGDIKSEPDIKAEADTVVKSEETSVAQSGTGHDIKSDPDLKTGIPSPPATPSPYNNEFEFEFDPQTATPTSIHRALNTLEHSKKYVADFVRAATGQLPTLPVSPSPFPPSPRDTPSGGLKRKRKHPHSENHRKFTGKRKPQQESPRRKTKTDEDQDSDEESDLDDKILAPAAKKRFKARATGGGGLKRRSRGVASSDGGSRKSTEGGGRDLYDMPDD